MFRRVIYEGWTEIIPMVSFWVLFIIFVAATIRSLMMKKSEVERMATLPLDDTPPASAHPHSNTHSQPS